MTTSLESYFGYVFEQPLLKELSEVALLKEYKAESIIIDVESYIKSIPLIIEGAIKILREDDEGGELVLYFLEHGDTCAMTLSCCMGQTKSKIRAVAETDVKVLMVPKEKMSEWMSKYKSWQEFILQSYHSRINEFIEAIDTIAFFKMDKRLMKYLKEKAIVTNNEVINATHKEISDDLNTSRVVVSRLLKKLEKEGKIKLFRNSITVLNLA